SAVLRPDASRPEGTQLARGGRVRQDRELLDIGVPMPAALELEMPLAKRAGRAEQGLGALRNRRTGGSLDGRLDGGHGASLRAVGPSLRRGRPGAQGRYSTPFADGVDDFFGSAVPMRSRYVVDPARLTSAVSSSTRRIGSVGSAKIAVPTWTATAPTARKSRT